jgi:peptidoglycan/LPS O-acetylase OafA/YrhL
MLRTVAAVVVAALPQFGPHRALTAVAVTIAGLLVADVLYRWVELPMIELGRRIIAHRGQRRATVEATPKAVPQPEPAPVG